MPLLISFLIYLIFVLALLALRIGHRPYSMSWTTAALGALAGLLSVFFWKLELPFAIHPLEFWPNGILPAPYAFVVDTPSWILAVGLACFLPSVLLTSPARNEQFLTPSSWIASFGITGLSILTVLAENPLTLLTGWALIDLIEIINLLRLSRSAEASSNAINDFSIRLLGVFIAIFGMVGLHPSGLATPFASITGQAPAIALILSAGLRLGVIPLRLRYRADTPTQFGFTTLIRVATAITSLFPIARISLIDVAAPVKILVLFLVGLSGLAAAWLWLTERSNIDHRQHYLALTTALFIYSAVGENPTGALAWAGVLLFNGAALFLSTSNTPRMQVVLSFFSILLIGLPFTFTSTVFAGQTPWPLLFSPLFFLINLAAVGGHLRHQFTSEEANIQSLPLWVQTTYPVGIFLGPVFVLILGIWGWEGSLQIGVWWAGLLALLLLLGAAVLSWRNRALFLAIMEIRIDPLTRLLTSSSNLISQIGSALLSLLERFFATLSLLLEGDGGIIWTGLIIVLLVLASRGL